MIRLFTITKISTSFISSPRLVKFYSTNDATCVINDNKFIIENIKNGIKHLRICDEIDLLPADLDWEYLLNKKNIEQIEQNNLNKKGVGDIKKVVMLIF